MVALSSLLSPYDDLRPSSQLAIPRIVTLNSSLTGFLFETMKVVPAKHIIEENIQNGTIRPDTLIVESSSGNFAYGLAVVCREKNLKLRIIGDPAIDDRLRLILQAIGAEVDVITQPDSTGSFQKLRLARVREILDKVPNSYWARQYDNEGNPESYAALAHSMLARIGSEFTLVAAVGSGGSSMGLIRALRGLGGNIELVAVDTFNSVLFGLPDGPRKLRGLGNSILPGVLRHEKFDEIHWVSAEVAEHGAWRLLSEHGLFYGPTTGAAFQVAEYMSAMKPRHPVVFIGPDAGHRYPVPADQRLHCGAVSESLHPFLVEQASAVLADMHWCRMEWGRKCLATAPSAPGGVQ